jgi:hypothetical protein
MTDAQRAFASIFVPRNVDIYPVIGVHLQGNSKKSSTHEKVDEIFLPAVFRNDQVGPGLD